MATLKDQVKRKLNITWYDEDTESRIDDVMSNAAVAMRHKLGIPAAVNFDFAAAGMENELYCDYCLYEWNNRRNEFDDAYCNDLLQCRARYEVAQWSDDDE